MYMYICRNYSKFIITWEIIKGCIGFRDATSTKAMDNEMETSFIWWLIL